MSTATASKTILRMGKHELEMEGPHLGRLREANALLGDAEALRARMEEDGYLFIRGLQKRAKAEAARRFVLEYLDAQGQLDPSQPLMDGVLKAGAKGVFLGRKEEVSRGQPLLDLLESPEIMGFFDGFFGEQALTFDYKWLRAVSPGGNTGSHYDVVYMGRGSARLLTCWTPLGEIKLTDGPLAILDGSHKLEGFRKLRETYGKMDVDRDNVQGTFSNDPLEMLKRFGGQWRTAEFRMGDVLIFGMYTMHASINNATKRYRLSADTRYQPASEPADERWMGEKPKAHYAWGKDEMKPMEKARREWGV